MTSYELGVFRSVESVSCICNGCNFVVLQLIVTRDGGFGEVKRLP